MHLDATHDTQAALAKLRTAGSVSISPELFEKLYLSPPNEVHGQSHGGSFGNPTPLALIGFLVALTPLSMDLLKWRGASGTGAAGNATIFFFGGMLMLLGGIGEWIIGNTFPFVVFTTFAAFWFGFSATLQPSYNAYALYSTDPSTPTSGLATNGFRSGYAFFLLTITLFVLICLICSLRTNLIFFLIFLSLLLAFPLLAAAYWTLNTGNIALGERLQEAGAACLFVCTLFGWYMFATIMLETLGLGGLPVVDLSNWVKGRGERGRRGKEA
ncbi:hypothetical protein M011DRAFT_441382 [Sporormia fimetaria CBS 119925]|uniref:GPR1/FUN34/YaaH-class plasma membrane protein n=1 Tax=Sporormia fimetaria CBS 119925 TaxID=1340428 RepID=A0A6A6VGD6_9PLEO|nr:hypothetical protein M011DRAFT_441382 [Sporormia fimetaria CBS 119925]